MSKLPPQLQIRVEDEIKNWIKEDSQDPDAPRRGGSTIPSLERDLYKVIKSVDFEKCFERVILQV